MSAVVEQPPPGGLVTNQESGLNANAMGFMSAIVVGLTSVAPPYSMAAIVGYLGAEAGVKGPGVMLFMFIPMTLIALSFLFLSRVDNDCGTTYTWVKKAFGPWFGWLAAWAVVVTGFLTIASFASFAMGYLFELVGAESWAESTTIVTVSAILVVLAMTWLGVRGTTGSARFQGVIAVVQVVAMALFVIFAMIKVYGGSPPEGSMHPELSWFSPFGLSASALSSAMLLAVFAYWGWESTVNLSEETTDGSHANGRAAVISTVILVTIYVSVAMASAALVGPTNLEKMNDEVGTSILADLANLAGGEWLRIVVSIAVIIAAIATTQTTIIPASRVILSMGRSHAAPKWMARIHPAHHTPHLAMWFTAAVSILFYIAIQAWNPDAMTDAFYGATMAIAFYYALNGFASAIYLRKTFLRDWKHLLFAGIGPAIGAAILVVMLVLQFKALTDPEASETGILAFGVPLPLVFGIGIFLLGVILRGIWQMVGDQEYFEAHPEAAPADALTEKH